MRLGKEKQALDSGPSRHSFRVGLPSLERLAYISVDVVS
jgi:hypothetical protein